MVIIREYNYGVHNARSAPVICPLNPTTVCTVPQVKMYCKRGIPTETPQYDH